MGRLPAQATLGTTTDIRMTIGLYLDVDNTLTSGFIQERYAELVEVKPQYLDIENRYQADEITSDEFGEQIIELFNRTQFTEQFAKENVSEIRLKDSARPLLKCRSDSIHIYFVSAGPCYYVRKLAELYEIPRENVLCSEYIFAKGKLTECNAVTPKQKHDFVAERVGAHNLTIGVGDDEIHDASFLDVCDIGLLTPKSGHRAKSNNHLCASRLSLILALIKKLDAKQRKSAVRT
jgi:phosphoserine phosphatase